MFYVYVNNFVMYFISINVQFDVHLFIYNFQTFSLNFVQRFEPKLSIYCLFGKFTTLDYYFLINVIDIYR